MILFAIFSGILLAGLLVGIYCWSRFVFGENAAGKITRFCLMVALAVIAFAILVEPVGLVISLFCVTVEWSHGWTLLIPAVLVGLPMIRLIYNRRLPTPPRNRKALRADNEKKN